MSIKIYSWNFGKSAKLLAKALGCKMLRHEGSQYRPKVGDTIVNYGASQMPRHYLGGGVRVINHPEEVGRAVNKLNFLTMMNGVEGVQVPPFTVNDRTALGWLAAGKKVLARTKLRSSEGDGIVVITKPEEMVAAPLYTRYIPKKNEYRIHVFDGKVIEARKKVLKADVDRANVNWYVRNTANGFVFQRNGVDIPENVKAMAIKCVAKCNLVFGGVDVITDKDGNPYVLEVNTAPGIEGSSVTNYVNAIKEYINARV